jgi:small subunit ribosomal protein S16
MAVKIRLTRMGKKRQPSYRVVVIDSRRPRDGEYIEQIGFYDPRENPSLVEIDNEKAVKWLRDGAQPTERAQKLLEISGAWTQFKVAKGQIHTVPDRTAPTPPAEKVVEVPVPAEPVVAEIAAVEPVVAETDTAESVAAEPVSAEILDTEADPS